MIIQNTINCILDSTKFSLLLASGVVTIVTALFYQLTQTPPPLPSGAGIATIHQDKSYGGNESQTVFNKWFAATVQQATTKLHQTNQTVESILSFIGMERRRIAQKLNHNHAGLFGERRSADQQMQTPITLENRYAAYREKCMELFFKKQGEPIQGILPGEKTPVFLSSIQWRQPHIAVIHAPFTKDDYSRIMDYLQKKTMEIFSDTNLSKKKLLGLLGTIHWWLAQTMIFERGSACITEIFIQAIASTQGYPASHWKSNTMPDLEAILSEHDDFVTRYEEMLLF